jgi:hypothetical protein
MATINAAVVMSTHGRGQHRLRARGVERLMVMAWKAMRERRVESLEVRMRRAYGLLVLVLVLWVCVLRTCVYSLTLRVTIIVPAY